MQAILGSRLRGLRRARGLTQTEAAGHLGHHASKISRLETGCGGCRDEDLRALLELYAVDESERGRYLIWARRVGHSWWPDDRDGDDSSLDALLDLAPLRHIRAYEQSVVPELLQTPDYARAVLELVHPTRTAAAIDRLLAARARRRALLDHDTPPLLWIHVELTALRRRIGGKAVWDKQIEYLQELAHRPRVTLQIVDDDLNEPARLGHGFTSFRFADPRLPDLVCIPQLTGVVCLDEAAHTDEYLQALDRLSSTATQRAQTLTRLAELRN
ncbi:helix-turn-helix domain-containing protein [Nocardia yunnanensis]|uniref:helix-turn-helix domain-containing protein n=1 Tax=Nocardia yunnanensis TaxID=2382165 RepID=UPI0013C3EABF|nr:helix-turn-helix transcriptional regulator [Nocardia yunnanensis]